MGSSSYSGETVREQVNVDKVLSDFKKTLREEAQDVEEKKIKYVMYGFDAFTQDIQSKYPDLADSIKKRQGNLISSLRGSIINYAERHVSENDYEFQSVLKMQPGAEKTQALQQKVDDILRSAQSDFSQKLNRAMSELQSELSERLRSDMATKEAQLDEEMKTIKALTASAGNEENNLQKCEHRRLIVAETAACLESILNQGEVGA